MDQSRIRASAVSRPPLVLSLLPAWWPRLAAIAFAALLLWFSTPTIASIYPTWSSYDYSHGYLIFPMAVLLLGGEVRRAPLESFAPSPAGFACFAVIVLVMVAAHAATTLFFAHLALPLLWMSAVWAFAGAANARRTMLPLGFLYFAIPVWDILLEPLRQLTIFVVSAWIRAAAVPAFIEGNLIRLPSGTLEVSGGCAGLRYAIVASALGAFGGILRFRRWKPTLLLMLLGLALALFGNWLRVFIMVIAGHASKMQSYLVVEEHNSLGWAIFVICLLPLFYVIRKLQSMDEAVLSVETPVTERRGPGPLSSAIPYGVGIVVMLGVWLNHRVNPRDIGSVRESTVVQLSVIAGWDRVGDWQGAQRPVFVGATTEGANWYADGGAQVGAYVANYAVQQQAQEVVFAHNRPEGKTGIVVARRFVTVASELNRALPVEELEVREDTAEHRLVWVTRRVAGTPAVGVLEAKFLQVSGVLYGRRDAQALVLTATCDTGCENARSRLARYAAAAAGPLIAAAERSNDVRSASAESTGDDR